MFAECDLNGDGKVTKEEFLTVMTKMWDEIIAPMMAGLMGDQ